ncbi:GlsB/YeaQ/YmgE family stress response membrane protein [Halomonas halocynthiae]|uniref:GlsB/YeaQ/YmgE family stress response membrane protein n=1 Tax=Halomonas halocynthiae TaxID=176290 RepID=UPI0003FD89A4|nr:GlsB/YeaQ/YmgE family stress response membrane protein [Halomonas halocynthiae]
MGILAWIILGLLAGALAKFIMPGKDGGGLIMTMVLGIIGAVVGGFISTRLGFGSVNGLNLGSIGIAVLGALIVLFIYKQISNKS